MRKLPWTFLLNFIAQGSPSNSIPKCRSISDQLIIDNASTSPLASSSDPIPVRTFVNKNLRWKYQNYKISSTNFGEFTPGSLGVEFILDPEIQTEEFNCGKFFIGVGTSEFSIDGNSCFGQLNLLCYRTQKFARLSRNVLIFTFLIDVNRYHLRSHPDVDTIIDHYQTKQVDVKYSHHYTASLFSMKLPLPNNLNSYYRFEMQWCGKMVTRTVFGEAMYISPMQYEIMSNWNENMVPGGYLLNEVQPRQVSKYRYDGITRPSVEYSSQLDPTSRAWNPMMDRFVNNGVPPRNSFYGNEVSRSFMYLLAGWG